MLCRAHDRVAHFSGAPNQYKMFHRRVMMSASGGHCNLKALQRFDDQDPQLFLSPPRGHLYPPANCCSRSNMQLERTSTKPLFVIRNEGFFEFDCAVFRCAGCAVTLDQELAGDCYPGYLPTKFNDAQSTRSIVWYQYEVLERSSQMVRFVCVQGFCCTWLVAGLCI